jgi:hypothetical protein
MPFAPRWGRGFLKRPRTPSFDLRDSRIAKTDQLGDTINLNAFS